MVRLHLLHGATAGWFRVVLGTAILVGSVQAQPVVPGTGTRLTQVGDDFEDETWTYVLNSPKSSRDLDGAERHPAGEAVNGRWYEGVKRGHPDIVRRIPTPANGLQGSRGALLLQSLHTGVPGRPSYRLGQDDLIADVNYRLGGTIPIARTPSVVVRIFLPPVAQWEHRSGSQFGFRIALESALVRRGNPQFSAAPSQRETYWPGIFVEFQSRSDEYPYDSARFRLRADRAGQDVASRQIGTTGWWTLGFSVTPDGMVHYYARPGVEPLTPDDRLGSEYPYGYRAETFRTFFFNVCSGDDGRSWSTPWVLDDPELYVVP